MYKHTNNIILTAQNTDTLFNEVNHIPTNQHNTCIPSKSHPNFTPLTKKHNRIKELIHCVSEFPNSRIFNPNHVKPMCYGFTCQKILTNTAERFGIPIFNVAWVWPWHCKAYVLDYTSVFWSHCTEFGLSLTEIFIQVII